MKITFPAILLASFPMVCSGFENDSQIGTVLQIQGQWRLEAQSPILLAGGAVPAGGRIKTWSAKPTDFLTVVLLDGRRLAVVCSADPCVAEMQLPAEHSNPGTSFQHMIEAVQFVLLNRKPEVVNAFSSTSSRGNSYSRAEIVALFEPGKSISLDSAFAAIPKGEYTLDVTRATDARILSSTVVHWRSTSSEPVLLQVPAPGSYVVSIQSSYEDRVGNIFLSVLPRAAYEEVSKSFGEARAMCAKWSGPDAASSAHLFIRAYLLALAPQ